jgi:hypothetical protein
MVDPRRGSHRVRSIISLLGRSVRDPGARQETGFALVQRFARRLLPGYVITEPGKSWFGDRRFLADYDRLVPESRRSADRKYFLRSILRLVDGLPGDTAECGVWTGSSSWFIAEHFAGQDKVHHGFDSFEGLSEPSPEDGGYWHGGDLCTPEDVARTTLADFEVKLYRGWIPGRFQEIESGTFCFVHVDVDLFEPTRDSIEFFYPRMVPGGVMLFDDYGFLTCPGATSAVNGYMAERPEPVIEVPTGQGFLIKRPG